MSNQETETGYRLGLINVEHEVVITGILVALVWEISDTNSPTKGTIISIAAKLNM